MQLAVFDVDGTLTRSNRVDNECFVRAVSEEIGSVRINTDWLAYAHVTDRGVTEQIFQERLGRSPREDELVRVQQCFVRLLEERIRERPETCLEIPGAAAALAG